MPAGIVKTPTTARAKDANVTKSADRSGSGKNTGSGGKKFVQTRLPFKLIASAGKGAAASATGAAATTSATSSVVDLDAEEVEREPLKRKLSYGCDNEPETEELRRSNSKENLELGVASIASSKKPRMSEAVAEDVIELDDDDEDEADNNKDKKEDKDKEEKTKDKGNKSKEKPAESAVHPTPIQIKLPMSNKRSKRRKSLKKPVATKQSPPSVERSDSSDDIEDIAESLNPQKRPKVVEPKGETEATAKVINEASEPSLNPQKRPKVVEPKGQTEAAAKIVNEAPESKSKSNVVGKSKADVEVKSKPEVESKDANMDVDTKAEAEAEVLLLDSSDNDRKGEEAVVAEQSSTDLEMDMDVDVDTDTLNKTSPEKEKGEEKGEQKAAGSTVSVADKLQNLTPKQQKLMEQRRKAREEKERKLQEERRLKQLEKEQREQQKKAERDVKEEQRRKEREDKEELKRKEREEKERKRNAENEEKRKRNEAKEEVQRKKDEERRRKEQEKEEAEEKKKRAAASFSKFFVPKQPKQSITGSLEHEQNSCDSNPSHIGSQQLAFRPFQVKDDMILAPVIRSTLAPETRQHLDKLFHVPDDDDDDEDLDSSIGRVKRPSRVQLYLNELSSGRHKSQSSKRDVRLQRRAKEEEDDDDVQVIDELANAGTPIVEDRPKALPWMRAKYLHFADNRRPPYYGTWRKRSQLITARRPLGLDKIHFDYEVDSDCEWEEEEPGESLSASEDEKERESEEESEEEYNEWFVPHGHLSDEELQNDGELEDGNTREAQKAKLQVLQQEFAQEMKKQTKKIKPRLLGPVWLDENGNKSELCPAVFIQTIDMYGCWQLQPLTLEPPPEPMDEEEPSEEVKAKPMQLDEPLLEQLVRLIHGNRNSKAFLISEYLEYLKTQITAESQALLPSKTLLREKFDELASWKAVELADGTEAKKSKKPKKRLSWVVNTETLQKYHLNELSLQNQWSYTLTPKVSKSDTSVHEASPPTDPADACDTPKSDKKMLSKLKDSEPKAVTTATASPTTATKKRGTLLMSVPRDQQFHVPTKNALISQYLRKDDEATSKKKPPPAPKTATNCSDDIVVLSD